MAFGQQSGPPATARQVAQLTELVVAAGHTDFRDARHPLGLTQRQAAGKFTRDEADELIARLEQEAEADDGPVEDGSHDGSGAEARVQATAARYDRRQTEAQAKLAEVPSEVLAAELQRRGWAVIGP